MSPQEPSEIQVLNVVGRAQSMIARLEIDGVEATSARSFLNEARMAMKNGNQSMALEYAKQCITEIVRLKRIADQGGAVGQKAPPTPLKAIPMAIPVGGAAPDQTGGGTAGVGPGAGTPAAAESAPVLKPYHSYLFEEESPTRCYGAIRALLGDGYRTMCITRRNPRMVEEDEKLPGARLVWLTESQPDGIEYVEPSLESLLYNMENFLDDQEEPVLFLDGIEYLMGKNSFEGVMSFIRRVVDLVSGKGAIFITVVSPKALGEAQTKQLERELERV